MEAWEALLLGAVEGITEYLPVSSTGHLILTSRLLGLPNTEANRAFSIGIQSGAILAVLSLYLPRARAMAAGLLGRDTAGLALLARLGLAFLPAAVVGLLLRDWIEHTLFGLWPVVATWFVGGALILALPRLRAGLREGRTLESLTAVQALAIGCAQCLALAPGTSRSLVTIAAGLFVGLAGVAAVEFSLLLGVLTLSAATVHEAWSAGGVVLASYGWGNVLLGFGSSFLSAWLAVRWLVAWLRTHGLAPFGWYRMALALATAVLLATGQLNPG